MVGLVAFPTLDVASMLGAGDAFFAGGPSGAATATQVVDVSGWAPEIDGRTGVTVRLSALLGGYRLSDDRAIVSARFRGPAGGRRAVLTLDAVTAAERGNATMLMSRQATAPVPRLTRSIAVTVRSGRPAAATTTPTSTTSRSCRGCRCSTGCRRGVPRRGGRSAASR